MIAGDCLQGSLQKNALEDTLAPNSFISPSFGFKVFMYGSLKHKFTLERVDIHLDRITIFNLSYFGISDTVWSGKFTDVDTQPRYLTCR